MSFTNRATWERPRMRGRAGASAASIGPARVTVARTTNVGTYIATSLSADVAEGLQGLDLLGRHLLAGIGRVGVRGGRELRLGHRAEPGADVGAFEGEVAPLLRIADDVVQLLCAAGPQHELPGAVFDGHRRQAVEV